MNDTLKLNTREIGRLLNRSADQLDQETLNKLQSSRCTALKYQQKKQQAPALAWLVQHGLIGTHSPGHKALGFGMGMLLALILLGSIFYLQPAGEIDHAEIDIAILTDDLPVDLYVD